MYNGVALAGMLDGGRRDAREGMLGVGMIGGRLRQILRRCQGRLVEFDLTPYEKLLGRIDEWGDSLKQQSDEQLKELSKGLTGCS